MQILLILYPLRHYLRRLLFIFEEKNVFEDGLNFRLHSVALSFSETEVLHVMNDVEAERWTLKLNTIVCVWQWDGTIGLRRGLRRFAC